VSVRRASAIWESQARIDQQWRVIRAATYNSLAASKTEGARVNDDMKRVIDKKTRPSTHFYCLREEAKK
jgi:hypothetical protein